jgi:uncharacterized protein YjbI with pentapeptide repeats
LWPPNGKNMATFRAMAGKNLLHRIRGGDPHQLAILAEGVSVWNRWRDEHPDVPIELSEVRLEPGTNLREINLRDAVLRDCHLECADLFGASLEGAMLLGANLQKAVLQSANLSGSVLSGANLQGASLSFANLRGTILQGAKLKGASLHHADFREADLRGVENAIFDESNTVFAISGLAAKDPWSVLRRKYTGVMLLFHLLLLVTFLLPYAARAVFWRAVNHSQQLYVQASQELVSELQRVDHESAVAQQVSAAVAEVGPCLQSSCVSVPIWRLLLQLDRGLLAAFLALTLVFYNALRALLTWRVGLMRDEEERSGLTPPWRSIRLRGRLRSWLPRCVMRLLSGRMSHLFIRDTTFVQMGYRPFYRAHLVLTTMFWSIVIVSLGYHGWNLLTTTVSLPVQ